MVDMAQADRTLYARPAAQQKKMSWTIALNRAAKTMGYKHYMDVPHGSPEDEELRDLAREIQITG